MAAREPIPPEVEIHDEPRRPEADPTLGVPVTAKPVGPVRHRLVTVGDSLTHGFMSGAVHRTDLSWPAITAYELGLTAREFTFPTYEWPSGPGGLPLDLERLARAFERRFGSSLDLLETFRAGPWLRGYMDDIEDHWERGPGAVPPADGRPFHNTAVYGWDVLDPLLTTEATIMEQLALPAHDDFLAQLVEHHAARAAWPILHRVAQQSAAPSGSAPSSSAPSSSATIGVGPGGAFPSRVGPGGVFQGGVGPGGVSPGGVGLGGVEHGSPGRTVLDSVAELAATEGVETLVVVLGSNNALGSVLSLEPAWTPVGYEDLTLEQRRVARKGRNLWRPSAFRADWAALEAKLRTVAAQHVVLATVPSVTIAPIARGVDRKVRPDSRYFAHYTRPWITDEDFDPLRDPHLTEQEVRGIDSAIDAYNETIIASVREARRAGLDWYLFDMGGLLDRLAARRYLTSPWARPTWWEPYELPAALQRLDPVPNTRFFRSGREGRTDGGLFSLDGVHPTTVGYGILAQEVVSVLRTAGVEFVDRQGNPRTGPIEIDFERLLRADTLLSSPPASITSSLGLLGWLDERLDWVTTFLPFLRSPL